MYCLTRKEEKGSSEVVFDNQVKELGCRERDGLNTNYGLTIVYGISMYRRRTEVGIKIVTTNGLKKELSETEVDNDRPKWNN